MYLTATPTLGANDPAVYSSNDFTAWGKFANGTGAAPPVVTPGFARAPDGTQTATRIVFNRGPQNAVPVGAYSIVQAPDIPGTNGQLYTDSVYLKLTPGAAPVNIDLRSALPSVTESNKVVTLSDQWQRFSLVTPAIVNGMQQFQLLLWDAAHLAAKPTSLAADVLAWGFRVDPGSVALGTDYSADAGPSISPAWVLGGLAALALLSGNRR